MTKRMAVGPKYRRGLLLSENGEAKWFGPGELIPEDQQSRIPGRFLRDKRVVFVDVEEPIKKKAPPKSKTSPKSEEKAENSASPSPTSEGAGASAPAPLEVTVEEEVTETTVTKKKARKSKKTSE